MLTPVNALAVLGASAKRLSFTSLNLDMKPPTQDYHVEVMSGNNHANSVENLPLVNLFNDIGESIAGTSRWTEEGFLGYTDFAGPGTEQFGKVELAVEDKAAVDKAVFLGETMKHCGASWYPSGVWMDIEGGRHVDCAWLRSGHDACGQTDGEGAWSGFGVERFSFWASDSVERGKPKDACSEMRPRKTDQCQTDERDEAPAIFSTLTKTARPLAQRVCDDPASYAPSLLSTSEGLLCDMRTRTLRPLCSNGNVPGCYQDGEAPKLVINSAGTSFIASDDQFTDSPFDLDTPVYSSGVKVHRRAEIEAPGTVVNYQESHHCEDCCVGAPTDGQPNVNATHYWGHGVDSPTPYRNMSGGIYIKHDTANYTFVADCGSSVYVTTYISRNFGHSRAAASIVGVVAMMAMASAVMW